MNDLIEKFKRIEIDDKVTAMICITVLGILGGFIIDAPTAVLTGAITALGALATGKSKS